MTTSPDDPVLLFTGPLTELEFVKSFLSASRYPVLAVAAVGRGQQRGVLIREAL